MPKGIDADSLLQGLELIDKLQEGNQKHYETLTKSVYFDLLKSAFKQGFREGVTSGKQIQRMHFRQELGITNDFDDLWTDTDRLIKDSFDDFISTNQMIPTLFPEEYKKAFESKTMEGSCGTY